MITTSMILTSIIVTFTLYGIVIIAETVYDVYKWNKEVKENKKKITIDERGDVVRINYYSKRDKGYKGVIITKEQFNIEKDKLNPQDELNNIIRLYYQNESK